MQNTKNTTPSKSESQLKAEKFVDTLGLEIRKKKITASNIHEVEPKKVVELMLDRELCIEEFLANVPNFHSLLSPDFCKNVVNDLIKELNKSKLASDDKLLNILSSEHWVAQLPPAYFMEKIVDCVKQKNLKALNAILSSEFVLQKIRPTDIKIQEWASLDPDIVERLFEVNLFKVALESTVQDLSLPQLHSLLRTANPAVIKAIKTIANSDKTIAAKLDNIITGENGYEKPAISNLDAELQKKNTAYVELLINHPATKEQLEKLKNTIIHYTNSEFLSFIQDINGHAATVLFANSANDTASQNLLKHCQKMFDKNLFGTANFGSTEMAQFFTKVSNEVVEMLDKNNLMQPLISVFLGATDPKKLQEFAFNLAGKEKIALFRLFLSESKFTKSIITPGELIKTAAIFNSKTDFLELLLSNEHTSGRTFVEKTRAFSDFQKAITATYKHIISVHNEAAIGLLSTKLPEKYMTDELIGQLAKNDYSCEVLSDNRFNTITATIGNSSMVPESESCTPDKTFSKLITDNAIVIKTDLDFRCTSFEEEMIHGSQSNLRQLESKSPASLAPVIIHGLHFASILTQTVAISMVTQKQYCATYLGCQTDHGAGTSKLGQAHKSAHSCQKLAIGAGAMQPVISLAVDTVLSTLPASYAVKHLGEAIDICLPLVSLALTKYLVAPQAWEHMGLYKVIPTVAVVAHAALAGYEAYQDYVLHSPDSKHEDL